MGVKVVFPHGHGNAIADGKVEGVVEVKLARPRREDEQAFTIEVRKLRGLSKQLRVIDLDLSGGKS